MDEKLAYYHRGKTTMADLIVGPKIKVRYIERVDLQCVLDCQRSQNTIKDDDLGEVLLPWTLTAEDIQNLIVRREDTTEGQYECRVFVLEALNEEGFTYIVGAFAVELHPTDYELVWFAIGRDGPVPNALTRMVEFLKERAKNSQRRKKIVVHLRDCDQAGLREYLPFLRAHGFQIELARDYFNCMDGWHCQWEVGAVR